MATSGALHPFDFAAVEPGAVAWLLAASALVLLMTPGVAFFYGGMVRAQHVLGMLMQNLAVMAVVSVVWVLAAFSLAFGGGSGLVGDLRFVGLGSMTSAVPGFEGPHAMVIPPILFATFQMMFAVITPSLITGATADRWSFGPFLAFVPLWLLLVYAPIAHWVFSPVGWAARWGALDFAGGTVVHSNAGAAGLAMALVLGRRRGWPKTAMQPHNLPLTVLGAALLWFGWFGFNAGSALRADQVASYAFLNTNTAAATGLLGWCLMERLRFGKPTTLGAASGAVTGLVAITPCAGYVTPLSSLVVGALAGVVCATAVSIKTWFFVDDSLDVVGVHLVGGIVGCVLIGFVGTNKSPQGVDGLFGSMNGLFYGGNATLLGHQILGVLFTVVWTGVLTTVIGLAIKYTIGWRVTEEEEIDGIDFAEHGESAYDLDGRSGGVLGGTGAVAATHAKTAATEGAMA
jgi:ammonium transporter, Amt family